MSFDPITMALRKGGFPVVKLTTLPTADGVTMTDEEAAQMDKAAEALLPIVIAVTDQDVTYYLLANVMMQGDTVAAICRNEITNELWCFVCDEGTWFARID